MVRTVRKLLCAVLAFSLLFSACGGQEREESSSSQTSISSENSVSQSETQGETSIGESIQNNQKDELPTSDFFQEQEQVSLQGSLLYDKYEGNAFVYFYYAGEEELYLRTSDGTNEYMYWCDADGIPSRQEQYPFGDPPDLRFPSEPDWELNRDTSTLYRYADGTLENTIVISGDRYQSDPICLFQEGPRVLYSEGENRQMIIVRELSEEVLRSVDLEELGYGDYRLVSIQPYDKKTAQLNLLTKEAKVFILLLDLDTMELVSPAFTQVETEQGKFLLSPYSLEVGGTVYPYQENTEQLPEWAGLLSADRKYLLVYPRNRQDTVFLYRLNGEKVWEGSLSGMPHYFTCVYLDGGTLLATEDFSHNLYRVDLEAIS